MKRMLLLLILILSACTDDVIDIKNNIRDEMLNNVSSFKATESFTLKQYGDVKEINVNNIIEYDSGIFSTTNSMKVIENHQTTEDYEFNTYVDVFNNLGLIKDESSSWYKVELAQMQKLKMGSIDPLLIVNSILYDTKSLTYKNEKQYSGALEDMDRVVSILDRDVFENMFSSSVFNFIEPLPKPYDYTVTATMKYNDLYKIEYIEFDLSDYKEKYRDYQKYELNSDITTLSMVLRLDFSDYENTNIVFNSEATDWIINKDHTPELKISQIQDNINIGDVKADVMYNSDLNKYEATVSLNLKEDVKYFSFEIFYLSEGKIINRPTFSNEYDFKAFETKFIDYQTFDEKIDHIYFKMRYVPENKSSIINVSEKVDFNLVGPPIEFELDLNEFDDKTLDLVPSILVDFQRYNKDQKKIYNVNLNLYSKDNIRNGEVIIYLFDEDKRKPRDVIQESDIVIDKYGSVSFTKEINFLPKDTYVHVKYNTSYLRNHEQKIKVDFKLIDGIRYSSLYKNNDFVNVNITEWPDSTWMLNKYYFQLNFKKELSEIDAYVYFLNNRYEVVGWEYLYAFDVPSSYLFVSDLYSNVEKVYIDLEVKGDILEKYYILGEISTNTN